ncbi:hypothetical protein B0T09DRAFT_40696 [Sordaria sp. MPI-SDFR-AT-0083]|nr:hypothetical protein B0T09DRAFT_40696 [Sordaria sp. MPI-SDFR-AT-0083]
MVVRLLLRPVKLHFSSPNSTAMLPPATDRKSVKYSENDTECRSVSARLFPLPCYLFFHSMPVIVTTYTVVVTIHRDNQRMRKVYSIDLKRQRLEHQKMPTYLYVPYLPIVTNQTTHSFFRTSIPPQRRSHRPSALPPRPLSHLRHQSHLRPAQGRRILLRQGQEISHALPRSAEGIH